MGHCFSCELLEGRGGTCFLCRNLRLRTFRRVEIVLSETVLFFQATDAPAPVTFLWRHGASSPASLKLAKTWRAMQWLIPRTQLTCSSDGPRVLHRFFHGWPSQGTHGLACLKEFHSIATLKQFCAESLLPSCYEERARC